jgi:hypothetical protein
LVVLESQVGVKRVDRIMSMAMTMLAIQTEVGFVNSSVQEPIRWCGIADTKHITVLQATRNN